VLSKAPGDADAVRVKVIASLYLNKYEEALAAAKGHEVSAAVWKLPLNSTPLNSTQLNSSLHTP
jgi:hypothetical protein